MILYAEDFRRRARFHLGGKWTGGKWSRFVVIELIQVLLNLLMSVISYVGAVFRFILSGPMALGMANASLNVVNGKDIGVDDYFEGFRHFGSAFLLNLINGIFIFLWLLLLIVPGIIKIFSYSMSYYILCDNPEMSANDVRHASIEMMKGNKWRYFCLRLSFIGWYILSILTLGILFLWVIPYVETACAEFYNSIKIPTVENYPTEELPTNPDNVNP